MMNKKKIRISIQDIQPRSFLYRKGEGVRVHVLRITRRDIDNTHGVNGIS
jgi:hypothetical protein